MEEKGETDGNAVLHDKQHFGLSLVKNPFFQQFLGRNDVAGHFFIFGQRFDKGQNQSRILSLRETKGRLQVIHYRYLRK